MEKQKTGFGITALVLGIVGLVLSFIPIINNLAFFLGILGVIFGIVALVTHNKKGISIAGLVTGILAMVITLSLQAAWSKSLNEVSDNLSDMTGENTEQLIGTAVDIQLGEFMADESEWDSGLEVTITNLTDEQASFDITIEAINVDGDRLGTDWIYVKDLRAGQSTTKEVFNLLSTEDYEDYCNATFTILEVSKY